MDFSLRSVRRPTVLSIPTAPFSFSTPLSSSVRSVDSTLRAFRGPTVAGLAAPFVGYDGIYGLNAVVVALCIVWYAVLHVRGSLAKRPSLGQAVDFSKNK